jgi:hypothetical protein
MKCKNCDNEFEKGKFCPECAFPVEAAKDEKAELQKLIKETHDGVSKINKFFSEIEERKKKREETKSKPKTGSGTNKGILDLF